MDSRTVTKHLKDAVFPLLREYDFSSFTSRMAYRRQGDQTHIIALPSIGHHVASANQWSSHSFQVNLGVWLHYVPSMFQPVEKDGIPQINVFHCPVERSLNKTLVQPNTDPSSYVYYIGHNGEWLTEALADVRKCIVQFAVPWFESISSDKSFFESPKSGSLTSSPDSPNAHLLLAYTAKRLGLGEQALAHLRAALDSGAFLDLKGVLEHDFNLWAETGA